MVQAFLQAAHLLFESAESLGQLAQNGVAVAFPVIASSAVYQFRAVQVQRGNVSASALSQRNNNVNNAFHVMCRGVVALRMK